MLIQRQETLDTEVLHHSQAHKAKEEARHDSNQVRLTSVSATVVTVSLPSLILPGLMVGELASYPLMRETFGPFFGP